MGELKFSSSQPTLFRVGPRRGDSEFAEIMVFLGTLGVVYVLEVLRERDVLEVLWGFEVPWSLGIEGVGRLLMKRGLDDSPHRLCLGALKGDSFVGIST